jgi:hypothetical protein
MDTENRRAFIQDPRADQEIFQPEGMSGTPVFFLWLHQSYDAHWGFAGLITGARPDRSMVYGASAQKQALDQYCSRECCDRRWTPSVLGHIVTSPSC